MKVIVLCGGSGSRLWPLSRSHYPKQFLRLAHMPHSIFQLTLQRALSLCAMKDIYFVTSEVYKHLIYGQIEEMGQQPLQDNILLEPTPKNTLPAIYFGVKRIRQVEDDVVVVFSSDHIIDNEALLTKTIRAGEELAREYIVTFGIKPHAPETVYGYIKPGEKLSIGHIVDSFHEKPDTETAKKYVEQNYLWNSGMFMFHTRVFDLEVKKHVPEVYEAFESDDIDECFKNTPAISIDYGLLEKSRCNAVLPMNVGWNDLGNFVAFYDKYHTSSDGYGNVRFNDEIIIDGKDNLIYSGGDKAIAVIGLSNVVVIDQKDALLVCDRNDTAKVGDAVKVLKESGDKRADLHLTEYQSWGSFTTLENGSRYKVRRLTLPPEKALPMQMHYHRSVHWIVVNGAAMIQVDDKESILRNGESAYVAAGRKYKLENKGKVLLEIMEVQSGDYLTDDDVVVFEMEAMEER